MLLKIKISVILIFLNLYGLCVGIIYQDLEGYLKKLEDSNYEVSGYNQQQNSGIVFAEQQQQSDNGDDNNIEAQFSKIVEQIPKPVSLQNVRDSMDKDTACCMLGQIAGDKGYHCQVKFYSNQIMVRNKNRAHNRKLPFYGREKIPNFGEKLMRRFEKCIDDKGYIFYHCCHLAAMEKDNALWPHYNTFKRNLYNLRINNKVRN